MAAEAFGAEVLKAYDLLRPYEPQRVSVAEVEKSIKLGDAKSISMNSNGADDELGKAKILPFKTIEQTGDNKQEKKGESGPVPTKDIEEEQIAEQDLAPQEMVDPYFSPEKGNKDKSNLNKLGINSAAGEQKLRELEEKKRKESSPSSSIFLLEEKERSKKSQETLKKSEIFDSYKKSMKVDIRKDSSKKSVPYENKGILINKKHS